jgi:predicted aldo/keto reductase-like oxidoreductase
MSEECLTAYAREAVAAYPDSDIEIAIDFCQKAVAEFVGTSNDRLVKVGRSLKSLVELSAEKEDEFQIEEALRLLVSECKLLVSEKLKVPKVPFGKTQLAMPIVTLGCMRFQQEWMPRITNMNQVGSDCQDNLVAILKQAISYGMTHIETARGYGCSELQLGTALKQLFLTKYVTREDLIIQTKIPPHEKVSDFRAALETSFRSLQVDYIDLFSFHGLNYEEQIKWTLEGDENCMAVVKEYMEAGKIRHVGFSTHASTTFILKLIDMDVFEYVNLHYHYFGSYTASGGGHDGNGNLDCVKFLTQKNMGIFIISPFDKGGRLYAPSNKLRSLTLPEMEPMEFKSQWIWNHNTLYDGNGPILHTYTVGAGRPSDLDQSAVAAYRHVHQHEATVDKLRTVVERLDRAKEEALGAEWINTWWQGLRKAEQSNHFVEHNQIVWCYNQILAFGLYDFAKNRYGSLEKNLGKWDDLKTPQENIDVIGKNSWGFVPGLALKPGVDYSDDFADVPPGNLERVKEAEAFVIKWCSKKEGEEEAKEQSDQKRDLRFRLFKRNISVSSQLFKMPSLREIRGALNMGKSAESSTGFQESESNIATESDVVETIPKEWETAYDMRPWPDYPDQPSRA